MAEHAEFFLAEFLPYLLNQAAQAASREFSAVYRDRYGMLNAEWRVLAHLGEFGPLTATEIGTRTRVHKTKISRAIAALEMKRFVSRETRLADRRSAKVSLTRQGHVVYANLSRLAVTHNHKLAQSLGQKDFDMLRSSLRRLFEGEI